MPDLKVLKNTGSNRYYLAASQTISPGDPVVLNTSGLVELLQDVDPSSDPLGLPLGVCMQNVTSSAAGDPVAVFDDPDLEFEILADTANEAVRSEVGDACDFNATNPFTADLNSATYGVIKVLAVNADFDPLLDGVALTGSALAGNFTPGWNSLAKIRAKFAKHVKANS